MDSSSGHWPTWRPHYHSNQTVIWNFQIVKKRFQIIKKERKVKRGIFCVQTFKFLKFFGNRLCGSLLTHHWKADGQFHCWLESKLLLWTVTPNLPCNSFDISKWDHINIQSITLLSVHGFFIKVNFPTEVPPCSPFHFRFPPSRAHRIWPGMVLWAAHWGQLTLELSLHQDNNRQ